MIGRITRICLVSVSLILISVLSNSINADRPVDPVDPRPPSINIFLYEPEFEIGTGPGYSGHGEITGNITLVKPSEARMESVFIELNVHKHEEDLGIILNPASFEFPGNGELTMSQNFSVEIDVDPMKISSYINGFFWIDGYWYYERYPEGGELGGISGEVFIIPFTKTVANLSVSEDLTDVPLGSWRTVGIEVENQGNVQIQISVLIENPPDDVEYYIETPKLTLNQGDSDTAYIRIRQIEGGGRTNRIKVLLSTKVQVERETDEVEIVIETKEDKGALLRNHWYVFILVPFIILMSIVLIILTRTKEKRILQRTDGK